MSGGHSSSSNAASLWTEEDASTIARWRSLRTPEDYRDVRLPEVERNVTLKDLTHPSQLNKRRRPRDEDEREVDAVEPHRRKKRVARESTREYLAALKDNLERRESSGQRRSHQFPPSPHVLPRHSSSVTCTVVDDNHFELSFQSSSPRHRSDSRPLTTRKIVPRRNVSSRQNEDTFSASTSEPLFNIQLDTSSTSHSLFSEHLNSSQHHIHVPTPSQAVLPTSSSSSFSPFNDFTNLFFSSPPSLPPPFPERDPIHIRGGDTGGENPFFDFGGAFGSSSLSLDDGRQEELRPPQVPMFGQFDTDTHGQFSFFPSTLHSTRPPATPTSSSVLPNPLNVVNFNFTSSSPREE